jgi:formylglycine-generating enzyme required for sulfatase activity
MQTRFEGMVQVVGGIFERGSSLSPDEQPVLKVEMSSFAIDRAPVTNKEFRAFTEAGGYRNPMYWTASGWAYIQANNIVQPTYWQDRTWNGDEFPVTGMCWWEALAYARFLGKTLPSEAQWEYACRGTDGRTYPWGKDEPTLEYANFAPMCEPVDRQPTIPGVYPKNVSPVGCVDMAGNFAEWCLDNYWPNYNYAGAASCDPLYFMEEQDEHVVRGGCGLHSEDYLRCSSRDYYPPGVRDNLIGFRCTVKAQ